MAARNLKGALRVAGIILADILVFALFWFLVLSQIREDNAWFYSLVYIPLGLAVAGTITGLLTYRLTRKKLPALLLLSPGFQMAAFLAVYTIYGCLRGDNWGGWLILIIPSCFIWAAASFLGSLWGFNLRTMKRCSTYSFDLKADTINKREHNS